ncbi:DNA repair protein RecO [Negadavirga shengliensis]|uniref:DNA repair protein RecO n=1 Tax=Negadavirga shengliensis TaxID=1389218 RepID=A0ABV9SYZ5_9BACT
MLRKTKGIVVNYIKYRDSSIITRVFTCELGMKTYIVNGVRSPKSKTKMAHYQPLTLLDLVVYEKESASINRIAEAKLAHAFQRIPFDFYRSGIAMFMGEVLSKVVYDDYQNESLFDFLWSTICLLDSKDYHRSTFILAFLSKASRFLGFEPEGSADFFGQLPQDNAGLDFRLKVTHMDQLMEMGFECRKIPQDIRKALLDDWLLFYKVHIESFGDLKSIQILRSLT